MALNILKTRVDPSGARRVWIENDATGEVMVLRFPAGLANVEMRARAQAIIDAEIERRQAEAAERGRVATITAAVASHFAGTLTAPQRAALLDALAREWRG